MQYNYSHDNDTIGYFCFQYDTPYPGPHTNNTYRYNISQNDGKVGAYGDGIEVRGSNGQLPTNFHIYNNTVYVTPSPNPNRTYGPNVTAIAIDSGSNGDVRNNICYSTTQDKIAFIGAGATVNFQGNDYWAANGGLNLNGYTSLSAWQSATGEETINGTALGYAINPVLTNPGGGGTLNNPHNMATLLTAYKLQNTSPMLKTGQNLSYWGINPGSYDFYGNSVSGSWAGIGAHTPNQTDATNFIANPGFETGTLANWSTWTDGVPGGWSPWVASGGGGAHSGTYYLVEQQGSTRSRVQVYQGLTGIPNGTYTFTAWLWGQGWSSPSYGEIGVHAFTSPDTYLYATDNPAGDGRWVQYPISNINVTTNGIYPFVESSLQNQWFCADDLSLQLVGPIQHQ